MEIPMLAAPLSLEPGTLVISTSALAGGDPALALGKDAKITIGVRYHSLTHEGWASVLYDGLADLVQKRFSLSVFKLAAACELFADHVFRKYLIGKDIDPIVASKLEKSARSWEARADRIADLASALLGEKSAAQFPASRNGFVHDNRMPRNSFAHGDNSQVVDHALTEQAWASSFDTLWTLDRINVAVTKQMVRASRTGANMSGTETGRS